MGYQVVLFDLDGTLTDSAPGITNAVRYALKHFGMEEPDEAFLLRFVGPPLHAAFREFCGFTPEAAEEAVAVFREYYREKGIDENCVYEGVKPLLASLKAAGKRLGVATSKPQALAERVIRNFGLEQYFDVVSGASFDETHSQKTAVILRAMETLSAEKNETLMIGDRRFDIEGAHECGIDACGVLYGYGSREEFAKAEYIAENVNDILQFT